MSELEKEIEDLVDVHNRIHIWCRSKYTNPTVNPGYFNLTKATNKIKEALKLIEDPML